MPDYEVIWAGQRGHYLLAERPSRGWVFADFGDVGSTRYHGKRERARLQRQRAREAKVAADAAVFGAAKAPAPRGRGRPPA